METLSHHNILVMLLSLGVLLAAARILGELAQLIKQPAVVGELLAGILLGPTILGTLSPELSLFLFPPTGPNAIALDAIATLAIILFLMVAGIEVDLSSIWRQGPKGLKIGIMSILIPFSCGLAAALILPDVLGRPETSPLLVFSLFIATALSISALPVIAKTLMDMDLYRSDLGMVVISAAILNDLIGWIIFAIILALMGNPGVTADSVVFTIGMTLAFTVLILTFGRHLIHKSLPFVQAYTRWPGGELSFAVVLAILGAALSELIGIHAIFGAFLVGAALGDSSHLKERTRFTIDHFVSFIFAPIFFASIGLKVNFMEHFDFKMVALVFILACFCKIAGGVIGARWALMSRKEAWATGFAMNSRGAMEIILGVMALEAGIISHSLFVALVVMALGTSMISGPMIRIILRYQQHLSVADMLTSKYFLHRLQASNPKEAICEMVELPCRTTGLDKNLIEAAVWERELSLSTGIGKGLALPHARIEGLKHAIIVVGISKDGIDFDAPDDKLAHVIFLILTPLSDADAQLAIASEISGIFRNESMLEKALKIKNFTDFMALLRTAPRGWPF